MTNANEQCTLIICFRSENAHGVKTNILLTKNIFNLWDGKALVNILDDDFVFIVSLPSFDVAGTIMYFLPVLNA